MKLRLAGPVRIFDAATRSSFIAERQRANTASPISVTGMPRSSALIAGPLAGAFLAGGVQDLVDQRLCRRHPSWRRSRAVISIR